MIELHGVSKCYAGKRAVQALDDVALRAAAGEITALIGPNGSGKTTLLRILSTLLAPDAGSIEVAGFDALKLPAEVRQRLGFLTGGAKLHRKLSARETLEYFAVLHGLKGAAKRNAIEKMADEFELGAFFQRPVETLSQGQRQRVMIARSLLHEPEVIILDEATVALDVLAARGLMEMMKRSREQGRTVLFATHQMSEVNLLADRVMVLHRGVSLYEGTMSELKRLGSEGQTIEELFLQLLGNAEKQKEGER